MSKLSQAPYLKLSDVGKRYPSRIYKEVEVLKNISFTLYKGQRLGIIGKNGAGKSTLIRLMGGVERPSSGTIERTMSISWPLAFTGGFQSTLSGLDNLKFVCHISSSQQFRHMTYISYICLFARCCILYSVVYPDNSDIGQCLLTEML